MGKTTAGAESRGRRGAAALALAVGGVVGPCVYVAHRLYQVAGGADPASELVVESSHVAFYWRCATSTWWAMVAAVVAYALLRRSGEGGEERVALWLRRLVLPIAILIGVLMWRFP